MTKSRLIHYASDGDLCTVQMTSQGSLRDVAEELKSFSRSALAPMSVDKARSAVRAVYPETSLREVENSIDRRASKTQEASGPDFPQSGLSMRPTSNSAFSVTILRTAVAWNIKLKESECCGIRERYCFGGRRIWKNQSAEYFAVTYWSFPTQ
jgi:hypothetical protein